ncbi:MAG TPA: SMI1/KNR4 family protein [Coleofasciculaceae cyanobacterium]|jgi:hypothetical protein
MLNIYLNRAKKQFQMLQESRKGSSETFPCSEEEVQKLEKNLGLRLPKAYKEFLLWIGAGGGPLEGQHFTDSRVQANRERAMATMKAVGCPESLPEDAIVFLFDQLDDYFFYIRASEGDNPPVHLFEAIGKEYRKIDNYSRNLEDYLLERINYQL